MIPIARNALNKYAVFFKVTLSDASDTLTRIGYDENKILSADEWKHNNIVSNIPTIYPETSEKFLPHELNLPLLNAVSFKKGCFTGQEIIARMEYRGKLKTQLTHITLTTSSPPERGADIERENKEIATVVDYCQIGYNSYLLLIITKK